MPSLGCEVADQFQNPSPFPPPRSGEGEKLSCPLSVPGRGEGGGVLKRESATGGFRQQAEADQVGAGAGWLEGTARGQQLKTLRLPALLVELSRQRQIDHRPTITQR